MIHINNKSLVLDSKIAYVESCVKILAMSWYLTKQVERPITDKHATILALYIMYGTFYETSVGKRIKVDKALREKVSSILNFKARSIDTHNHQLRKIGYIEMDDWTTDLKRLSSLFTPLKEELDKSENNVEIAATFKLEFLMTFDVNH